MTTESETEAAQPQDGAAPRGSRPLIATLVCVVFLFVKFFITGMAGESEPLDYPFGVELVWGLAVWLIAYFVTIRRASTLWKVLSFVIVMIVAALNGSVAASDNMRAQENQTAIDQIVGSAERLASGEQVGELPVDDTQSPAARILNTIQNNRIADNRTFDQEAEEAGLFQILMFEELTPDSEVLGNCDAIAALSARNDYFGGRFDAHMATTRSFTQELVASGDIGRAAAAELLDRAEESRPALARYWELNGVIVEEAAANCRILARGEWTLEDGTTVFDEQADLDAFNSHIDAIAAASQEIQQSNAAVLERTRQ
jgi:hypothetical protein